MFKAYAGGASLLSYPPCNSKERGKCVTVPISAESLFTLEFLALVGQNLNYTHGGNKYLKPQDWSESSPRPKIRARGEYTPRKESGDFTQTKVL